MDDTKKEEVANAPHDATHPEEENNAQPEVTSDQQEKAEKVMKDMVAANETAENLAAEVKSKLIGEFNDYELSMSMGVTRAKARSIINDLGLFGLIIVKRRGTANYYSIDSSFENRYNAIRHKFNMEIDQANQTALLMNVIGAKVAAQIELDEESKGITEDVQPEGVGSSEGDS